VIFCWKENELNANGQLFLLDREGFSSVPETLLATLEVNGVSRTGSLQRFVDNDGASWDLGPSRFPVHEVHKIGVLDLRILNNDRHGGNILFVEQPENGSYMLIPIDHELSLSSKIEGGWFEWITWPQAKLPFDEETKQYIAGIDVESDARLLRDVVHVREECVRTMIISSTLLKKGAAAGLTLYDIGMMAARTDLEEPSPLENMVRLAHEKARSQDPEERLQILWQIMDDQIANL